MKNASFSILLVVLLAMTSLIRDVTPKETATYKLTNNFDGWSLLETKSDVTATTFGVTSHSQWYFVVDDVKDGREIVDRAIMTYFDHHDGSIRRKRDLEDEGIPPFALGETPIVDMDRWEEEHERAGENPEMQGL